MQQERGGKPAARDFVSDIGLCVFYADSCKFFNRSSIGHVPALQFRLEQSFDIGNPVFFTNGAKGYSALHMSRDLDVQYKTAFILLHKIREAMSAEDDGVKVSGEVEVNGMYAGGYVQLLVQIR